MHYWLLAVAVAATAAGADGRVAAAQTPASVNAAAPLELGQAMSLAAGAYPTIGVAAQERLAAEARIGEARAAYLPQVNLLAQINRATFNNITGVLLPQSVIPSISGPPFPSMDTSAWNSGAGVLAVWKPFDFGERGARLDAAREAASAARQAEAATVLDVELAAAKAYLNVIAAQSLRATAEANVERLRAFAVTARALVDNKLRAGVELSQAEAAVAMAEVNLANVERNVAAQRATLEKLVGRPLPSGLLALPEGIPALPIDGAIDDHPLTRRELARVAEEEAKLKAVSRSYAPDVSVIGSASSRGSGRAADGAFLGGSNGLTPNTGNWGAGVQITIPLGAYPVVRSRQQAQRATLEAERRRLDEVRANLGERLLQAKADLEAAQTIMKIVPASLAAARAGEEQQRARFRSGLASAVEFTAATAALAQAEAENAIARVNLWRAAAELHAADGDLGSYKALASALPTRP